MSFAELSDFLLVADSVEEVLREWRGALRQYLLLHAELGHELPVPEIGVSNQIKRSFHKGTTSIDFGATSTSGDLVAA